MQVLQVYESQVIYLDCVLFPIVLGFFFPWSEWLVISLVSLTESVPCLFSRELIMPEEMHAIFLCYGLLLTRDSKLFIINLISLRAISSNVAGVLSIKDQICWFVSLKDYLLEKCCLSRKKIVFMSYCIYLFIFIYFYYIIKVEIKTCCKLKTFICSKWRYLELFLFCIFNLFPSRSRVTVNIWNLSLFQKKLLKYAVFNIRQPFGSLFCWSGS